ncbi:MAG: NUDIX domain-containing protein [Caulobacteraceae bacterium]
MASNDHLTSEGPLQFGLRARDTDYADRPCAYGVVARDDGRIAVVKVTQPEASWYDLPGGAIDPGEDEGQALVREFGEETGLIVRPGALIARASQYMVKTDGAAVNNRSGLYMADLAGEDPALKIEHDHTLEWLPPEDALKRLRHDSHAWAVAVWLRSPG